MLITFRYTYKCDYTKYFQVLEVSISAAKDELIVNL